MSKLDEIVYSHIGADVTTFNGVKVVNLSDHRVPSEQVKENIKKLMLELVENAAIPVELTPETTDAVIQTVEATKTVISQEIKEL